MKTSGLGRFALGQAVPDRDHAVCVSLSTFSDLIGYEEKKPEVLAAMPTGYPRFVRHHLIGDLIRNLDFADGEARLQRFLFSSLRSCREAARQLSIENPRIEEHEGFTSIQLPSQSRHADGMGAFLQHTGCGISSRQAEHCLMQSGKLDAREKISPIDNPAEVIRKIIARVHGPGVSQRDVLLASSGANAFYSLFRSACEFSRTKNKKIWIRLGWLYLDTIEVMDLVGATEETILSLNRLDDFEKMEEIFAEHGDRIAGVVTEFPTNPLLQAFDLRKVRELCNRAEALLIIDPTMASPKNAKVVEVADVIVNSLTKYAGSEGDVMMGSLVFPQSSSLGRELMIPTTEALHHPFERDLLRMAEQISGYENFIERTNLSLLKVVDFLEGHPKVSHVYWAYQSASRESFERQAGANRPGCVVSFLVNGCFETFYNRLEMLKSPSFGTRFSLCCPYVFLAHYKLLQRKSGRKILSAAGLSPNLLRLSVGTEEPDQIIDTLKTALSAI